MENRNIQRKVNSNAGFTLVELVVVLVLMMILLSLVIFGGLSWQDWTRYKHENTVAEDVFFAAQNQITEWDAGNALERKIKPIKGSGFDASNPYVLAYSKAADNGTITTQATLLESIQYDETHSYDWDEVWGVFNETEGVVTGQTNRNLSSQARTIVRLRANENDYTKYLQYKTDNSVTIDPGTVLLFDMVSQYIADTSVLNGSIILEFSPEAAQVFSVCYSDRASEFYYDGESSSTEKPVSVMDRSEGTRRDLMFGYFSVSKLAEKIKGKSEEITEFALEIRNGELLELVVHNRSGLTSMQASDTLKFTLFDGDDPGNTKDSVMEFTIKYGDITKNGYEDACLHPAVATNVSIQKGKLQGVDSDVLKFRFPAWIEDATPGSEEIHIALDGADVQAGSASYAEMLKAIPGGITTLPAFGNTFSFYRFGLAGEVRNIHAELSVNGSEPTPSCKKLATPTAEYVTGYMPHVQDTASINANGVIGESVAFYTSKANGNTFTYELKNGRHLYNVRYETEFKKKLNAESNANVFVLAGNIDWNKLVGANDQNRNYFLNSYNDVNGVDVPDRVTAGINYPGWSKATNPSGDGVTVDLDTSQIPFPGFRCLGEGDKFTQTKAYEENATDTYKISNLKISFAANVLYGVYENVFIEAASGIKDSAGTTFHSGSYSSKAFYNDDFRSLMGLHYTSTAEMNNHQDSTRSNLARGGALPLGLFAENLGIIENITLDNHEVKGLEKIGSELVYTCMVGGFVGNNYGKLENLTLLNSNEKTHVNGRTDVGGIVGRQSFALPVYKDEINILGMKNFGQVTGLENIGGIVGRAYVHYIGEDNPYQYYKSNGTKITDEKTIARYAMYHDGYFVTDTNKSMTGATVTRAYKVMITDCENRGKISGDSLFDNDADVHCSFIGGIAGITMDGLIIDDGNNVCGLNKTNPVQNYTFTTDRKVDGRVAVDNCSSFIEYTDAEIKNVGNRYYRKDYYVGGLIGYARLTQIKGADIKPEGTGLQKNFVLGAKYVGGIVGCSDMSRYDERAGVQTDSVTGRKYRAVNYNHVIGRMYVGGIAGAMGIGDSNPATLSFRDPADNEGSAPSKLDNKSGKETVADTIKNAGVVLALKNGAGAPEFGISDDNAASAGACGGITGALSHAIFSCDNIQPSEVKKYAMSLAGINENGDQVIPDEEILFGGNYVGGLIGYEKERGHMNSDNVSAANANPCSYIEAVVYGQNQVGGGVGYVESDTIPCNYVPRSGMLVKGTDYVGGICGHSKSTRLMGYHHTAKAFDSPYKVVGRFGVGGVYGRAETLGGDNWKNTLTIGIKDAAGAQRISITGKAYVGGFAGIIDATASSGLKNCIIQGTDVTGDYFVGGVIGAITNNGPFANILTNFYALPTTNVKANKAFAGGVAGLYLNSKNNSNMAANLIRIAKNNLNDSLENVYNGLIKNDLTAATSGASPFGEQNNLKLTFNSGNNRTSASVGAGIFAGGLFGYVPNAFSLEVNGFENKCNIQTYEAITGSYDSFNSTTKYSYLGAVVGRVSHNMKLENCSNSAPSYGSDKASYLGYLAEVNAGLIQGTTGADYADNPSGITYLENKKSFSAKSGQGAGGFVGVNGTPLHSGTILFCKNTQGVSSSGTAGGIAAVIGGNSFIQYCMNTGSVSGGSGNAGGMAGAVISGVTDTNIFFTACVNLGGINATNAAGIVSETTGKGTISLCRNYGPIAGDNGWAISATAAASITDNLEAGGMYEVDGKPAGYPIAPSDGTSTFSRNFYINGFEAYVDPAAGGSGNGSASGAQDGEDTPDGDMKTTGGEEDNGPDDGENNTHEDGENTPVGGLRKAPEGGDGNTPEAGDGNTPEGGDGNTPEGGEGNTPEGGETPPVADPDHWPKQLYVKQQDAGGEFFYLVWKTDGVFEDANQYDKDACFNVNPLRITAGSNKLTPKDLYTAIDAKMFIFLNDTTNYSSDRFV